MSSNEADYAPSDVDGEPDVEAEADVNADVDVEMEEESFTSSAGPNSSFESIPNGLGEWEEMHGNYVLRPPASTPEPRCVSFGSRRR
jgi:hypothetical protein